MSSAIEIALASRVNTSDPTVYSGWPARLADALEQNGVRVHHVGAALSRTSLCAAGALGAADAIVRRELRPAELRNPEGRATLANNPLLGRLRSRLADRALRHVQRSCALVIQIDSELELRTSLPLVVYEDMTVAQASRTGFWGFARVSDRSLARRLELQRRLYARARVCCTTSSWVAGSIAEDYGIPAEKIVTVGIGMHHQPPAPPDRDWSRPRYLFVGLDWRRKNGEGVLAAFRRVQGELPGAELTLVGDHPEVREPGVRALGVLSPADKQASARLEAEYVGATCFVVPSHAEPSAISYLEAMSAGIPAIGSAVGGAAELIGDGGCVVDPRDEEALVAAMRHYADPRAASETGARARARAELYTWPRVARRILVAAGLPNGPALPDERFP